MVLLFTGDSITDAGRGDYENPRALGSGYPRLLAADLTYEDTEAEVLDTGISGNRVVDLLARWKKDCLNLKPDVLTILIGVNDVWHELNWQNGVAPALFEEVYRILLREVKEVLPKTRVILMGAYVTHGTATDENWEYFEREVRIRSEIVRRLAAENGLDFVDLQDRFEQVSQEIPVSHWTVDGVHPTNAGHKLIAEAWKKVYYKK